MSSSAKNTSLLFLLFVFQIHFIFAQTTWAGQGAKWHYDSGLHYLGADIPGTHFIEMKEEGDSFFQGQNCKKLVQYFTSAPAPPNFVARPFDTVYTYTSGEKVFFWQENAGFKVLYDFGLQPGDTSYIFGTNDAIQGADSGLAVVDSVGTWILNNDTLRYYTLRYPFGSPWNFSGRIVEKLGHLNYLFPESGVLDPWNEFGIYYLGGQVRCYEDSVFGFYNSGIRPSCDFTTVNTEKEFGNTGIHISTGKDFWRIQSDLPRQISSIRILTVLGEELNGIENEVSNDFQLLIRNHNLPAGIYCIQITLNYEMQVSEKLLKSE